MIASHLHQVQFERSKTVEEELYDIQEAFHFFDKVGDQKIGVEQVGTCVRALGLCPTEAQIGQLIKQFDKDARLSIEQFTPIFRELKKADHPSTENRDPSALADILSHFDRDGSGQIELALLTNVLTTMGEPLSSEECGEVFSKLETDQAGMLPISDLASLISTGSNGNMLC